MVITYATLVTIKTKIYLLSYKMSIQSSVKNFQKGHQLAPPPPPPPPRETTPKGDYYSMNLIASLPVGYPCVITPLTCLHIHTSNHPPPLHLLLRQYLLGGSILDGGKIGTYHSQHRVQIHTVLQHVCHQSHGPEGSWTLFVFAQTHLQVAHSI